MSTLTPTRMNALAEAAESSVASERATALPAELSVAQWALETGWGERQPGRNCFGIKAYANCWGVQELPTTEVIRGQRVSVIERFATFPSLQACFQKHAELLTAGRPYAFAWGEYLRIRNLENLIRQIALLYSTDPNYAAHLLRILAMPEVKAALATARGGG